MKRIVKIWVCIFSTLLVNASGVDYTAPAVITIKNSAGRLFILKDRASIERPLDYEINKNDNTYIITYKGSKPKILYLNERPIYITPGDIVNIDYKYIAELGRERDTIIAEGDNAKNYMFSPLLLIYKSEEKERKVNIFYPKLSDKKYTNALNSYFYDLEVYRDIARKYQDSILIVKGYNKDIRRQAELDNYVLNMFANRYIHDQLLQMSSVQLNDFSDKLQVEFESRNISAQDTLLSPNIEGAISAYYNYLKVKTYSSEKTDDVLNDLYLHIDRYPNRFVREYFLYYFWKDFKPKLSAETTIKLDVELKKIENKFINAILKNKYS